MNINIGHFLSPPRSLPLFLQHASLLSNFLLTENCLALASFPYLVPYCVSVFVSTG